MIIPVYNSPEQLRECLVALAEQSFPRDRFEVIVVDNGSPESHRPIVEAQPGCIYLEERQPGSYAARNRGLLAARGEILAFTDADCLPQPNWLFEGNRALAEHAECGFVGGRVEIFPVNSERPTAVELYDMAMGLRQDSNVDRWHFAATANMFTRRSIMDRVGPFNSTLKSSGDLDWGQRATAAGALGHYEESAVVRHPARDSLAAIIRQQRRHAGGHFDRRKSESRSFIGWKVIRSLWRQVFPNFGNMRLARHRLNALGYGPWAWIRVAGLIVVLQYARFWEFVRRVFGGSPERS